MLSSKRTSERGRATDLRLRRGHARHSPVRDAAVGPRERCTGRCRHHHRGKAHEHGQEHTRPTDPLVAVRETLEREPFDEVIVSTLPARVSHWLHRDLPSRLEQLGVPVTVVTARTSSRRLPTERQL